MHWLAAPADAWTFSHRPEARTAAGLFDFFTHALTARTKKRTSAQSGGNRLLSRRLCTAAIRTNVHVARQKPPRVLRVTSSSVA